MADEKRGFMRLLNDKQNLAAAAEADFTFTVPAGGIAKLRGGTYHIFRNTQWGSGLGGEGGNTWTSEEIYCKAFKFTRKDTSDEVDLIDGDSPNIKEILGDGKLQSIFDPQPELDNDQKITLTIQNDDAVTCTISITLWVEISPIDRKPASG